MTLSSVKMFSSPLVVYVFLSVFSTVHCNSGLTEIHQAFLKLQAFVQSDGIPKGKPWPPLKSKPCRNNNRIAIVGAGLAGLHMAYLLQKKGFNNVVVFEKESRVGGKVFTIQHKGVPHEMGACYTNPDYVTNVYELANELGINEFVPIPTSTVWLDGNMSPKPYGAYVIQDIMKLTGAKTPTDAIQQLISAAYRYAVIHRKMFGKYKGDLMLKPSKLILRQLNQTIFSFLKNNDLLALAPLLTAGHTMQGYGHIDETSLVYGMTWSTPTFITALIARALNVNDGGTFIFRNGFMQITDRLASLVNVRLNVDIKRIKREGKHFNIIFDSPTCKNKDEVFDFLIWAADAREALKVLDSPTQMENSFSRLRNTWFTTTLFDSTERCRSLTAVEYWLDNLENKREHSLWARRHSEFAINGTNCNSTTQEITNMSAVSYQMGNEPPCKKFVGAMFDQQFQSSFGARNIQIIERRTWNYFPRFSVADIADGMLWKIVENQGERRTWFIGGSVSFESTKSIIEYNKLMIERMGLKKVVYK